MNIHNRIEMNFTDAQPKKEKEERAFVFISKFYVGNNNTLQFLHNLTDYVVCRFEGSSSKNNEGSVVALFNDPNKALKAAVLLLQRIQTYEKNSRDKNLSVKICAHYGSAVKEDDFIYGSAVDALVQLFSSIGEDELCVTEEFYNSAKNIQHSYFKTISTDKKQTLYKVNLDERSEILKDKPVVCLHLIRKLADSNFLYLWKDLIQSKLYENIEKKIQNKNLLSDDFIFIHPADDAYAVETTEDIVEFIINRYGKQDDIFPIQALIITNFDLSKSIPDWLYECVDEMIPGCLYISEDIFYTLENTDNLNLVKVALGTKDKKFYRMFLTKRWKNYTLSPFFNAYAFTSGSNYTCFYCGSRRHKNYQCPSKKILENTDSVNKLGYLSPEKTNSLFLKLVQLNDPKIDIEKIDKTLRAAFESFFEITKVYQIRFLKSIWNIKTGSWATARKSRADNLSGILWLAVDAIRTSNYKKANELLISIEESSEERFKLYCGYSFLFIDSEDYGKAEDYLRRALTSAKSELHKTYLKLLIARIYFIQNRLEEAVKLIEDIFYGNEPCFDAVYLAVILHSLKSKDTKTLHKLMTLFEANREFFIFACIDPCFFSNNTVLEKLNSIFKTVKTEAEEYFSLACSELNILLQSINKDVVSDILALYKKAKEAVKTESYFGYLDAEYYSKKVIEGCKNFLQENKDKAKERMIKLLNSSLNILAFFKSFKYSRFIGDEQSQAEEIVYKLKTYLKSLDSATIKDIENIMKVCSDIEGKLPNLESKVSDLAFLEKTITASLTSGKMFIIAIGFLLVTLFLIIPAVSININSNTLFGNMMDVLLNSRPKLFYWGGLISIFISTAAGLRSFLKK